MSPNPKDAVLKKALTDTAFKSDLVKNPGAAIEKAAGVKVPQGITVKVLEDTATLIHLVLPAPMPKGSLSDAQLASVAGGLGSTNLWCTDSSHSQVNFCAAPRF